MATRRDYASKKRSGKTATRSSGKKPAPQQRKKAPVKAKKPFPVKLMLVTVLMSGALIYLLYSLLQVRPGEEAKPVAVKPKPAATVKAEPAKPKPASKPQTTAKADSKAADEKRFEFYEMLPKSKITTSDPTVYKSTPKSAKSENTYLLQTGSFRNAADADRMRAQLILLGLPNVASQKSTNDKGETWYRVRTGPFDNRVNLQKAYDKLTKQNIFPLKIKAN